MRPLFIVLLVIFLFTILAIQAGWFYLIDKIKQKRRKD